MGPAPTVDVEKRHDERLDSRRISSCRPVQLSRTIIIVLTVSLAFVWVTWAYHPGIRTLCGEHDIVEHGGEATFEEFDWYKLQPQENITWIDCFANHKCARLSLPLDYNTPDGPKTEIALRLHPATDMSNYKGSLMVNPGGPGASGTAFVAKWGDKLQKIVGPEFDILGFDPRGTGASTPLAQCFDSEQQYQQWSLQSLYPLIRPDDPRSLAIARGREAVLAERCARAIGGDGRDDLNGTSESWGIGRFMSTAHVVNDMAHIVEKLGQEKLQFWGFSYGSLLGQYFATLYPDKVRRLAIDGVWDAANYTQGDFATGLTEVETVIHAFYEFCYKGGPSRCALYESSPQGVKNRVDAIFSGLRESPVPVPFASSGPALITEGVMKNKLFSSLYTPIVNFPIFADHMRAIETRNQTSLETIANGDLSIPCDCNADNIPPWSASTHANQAVMCSDMIPVTGDSSQISAFYANVSAVSPLVAQIWLPDILTRIEWSIETKWRFEGPFGGNTSYPILILENTYDPVSSLVEARAIKDKFVGAAMLEHHAHGHCTISSPSLCTAKAVRAYFANGTLPEPGTVCEPEELPFVGKVNILRTLSQEDEELLEALDALKEAIPRF